MTNTNTASDDHKWVVVGPYCWGTGKTRKQAQRRASENCPRSLLKSKRPKYVGGIFPTDAYVDDMGAIHSKSHDPAFCTNCDTSEFDHE